MTRLDTPRPTPTRWADVLMPSQERPVAVNAAHGLTSRYWRVGVVPGGLWIDSSMWELSLDIHLGPATFTLWVSPVANRAP